MPLPALPTRQTNAPWSPSVRNAYARISEIYNTASAYLDAASYDSHRLEGYLTAIVTDVFPIVLLLEESLEQEGIPTTWLELIANKFTELYGILTETVQSEDNIPTSNVTIPAPVFSGVGGRPGRPKKTIDPEVLRDALSGDRRISIVALAKVLGVHRNTLRRKVRELDITTSFDIISDEDLDEMVRSYRQQHPSGGRSFTAAHLRAQFKLRIPRIRIVASMNRVDRLGQGMRQHVGSKKKRRQYSVPRPNALWHIDGHHKLILWGIVIHGMADGFSRTVTGLRASTSNSAETVLKLFVTAIQKYGVPSRVRGDRGGENRDVSILMILLRGINRASFMWGSSVFNTRIERLWVDVGKRFARAWRAFFTRLERLHLLNRKKPGHLWLIQYLFLDAINTDCDRFTEEWNSHPIRGTGGNKSPNDMMFLGQLQHGIYNDPCDSMSIPQINGFYGFGDDGEPDPEEGPDSSDEEDNTEYSEEDSEMNSSSESESELTVPREEEEEEEYVDSRDELDFDVAEVIDANIRHDSVPVPEKLCPFNDTQLELFVTGLRLLQDAKDIPIGYGTHPSEWDESGYPTTEIITVGLRKKSFPISLVSNIWLPRAQDWARALYVMDAIIST